jgi:hypothetical protein
MSFSLKIRTYFEIIRLFATLSHSQFPIKKFPVVRHNQQRDFEKYHMNYREATCGPAQTSVIFSPKVIA